jgi:hypothetical protein
MSSTPLIFEQLLGCCRPVNIHFPGQQVAEPDDLYTGCPHGNEVLAVLAETFTTCDQIAAGVAYGAPEALALYPALVGVERKFVALRAAADQPPFAIQTESGLLPPGASPIESIFQDYRITSGLCEPGDCLLIAADMENIVALRRLGWPAFLAQDLLPFSLVRWSKLTAACGWAQPNGLELPVNSVAADTETTTVATPTNPEVSSALQSVLPANPDGLDEPPEPALVATGSEPPLPKFITLVLVGWSVARLALDLPSVIALLASALWDAHRYLGIDLSPCPVWLPTAPELTRIKYCREMGAKPALAQAVQQSLDRSLFTVEEAQHRQATAAREPVSYLDAYHELEKCQRAAATNAQAVDQSRAAQLVYAAAVDRELILPLREQALANRDPQKRSLSLIAADLAELLHHQAPFVLTSPDLSLHGRRDTRELCAANSYLKTFTQYLNLYRELHR